MNINFKTITDSRIQLHWASQLLCSAADAMLEIEEDDSHSNLGWDADSNQLVGRANCHISVNDFHLHSMSESYSLQGQTLASARNWLSGLLGKELSLRDYEMPEHGVSVDQNFSPQPSHLESISEWLTFAQNSLSECGSLRVWPHHFDLGFWNPSEVEGKSIGGGFSLGDHHYDQPYFYVNPYGVEKPSSLAKLNAGHWSEHWFGAVLLAEDIFSSDDRSTLTREFIQAAIRESKMLTQSN